MYAKQCNLWFWDNTKFIYFQEQVNVTDEHFKCLWIQQLICLTARLQLLELAHHIFTQQTFQLPFNFLHKNPLNCVKWWKDTHYLKCLKKILSPHYVFPGKFGLKRHQALQSAVTHVPDSQSLGSHDNPYTIIKFWPLAPLFSFVTATAIKVLKMLH